MKKLITCLFVVLALGAFAEPVEISSGAEFMSLISASPSGDFKLTADIDFGGTQTQIATFSGTLDGDGHSLSGLSQQLFGTLTGTIKNLTVKDWTANSKTIFPTTQNINRGIIADVANDGAVIDGVTVKNCTFRSARTVTQYIGGFIGCVTSATDDGVLIKDSVLDTCLIGNENTAPSNGGFVGKSDYCVLTIQNCEVVASTIAGAYAGGIISRVDNPGSTNVISGCSVGGTIKGGTAAAGICVGGRTQVANSTAAVIDISRCRNSAAVSAGTTGKAAAGGIYGYTYRNGYITISDCENLGAISGSGKTDTTDGYGIGGIVGAIVAGSSGSVTKLDIARCVNYGDVTATYSSAGGILGNSGAPSTSPSMSHCSNYGSITAADYAGGIVGYAYVDYSRITISDFANYGAVTATDKNSTAGGIFAYYGEHSGYGTPARICSFGSVTAGACAGAIYGSNNHCDKALANVPFKNSWLSCSVNAETTGVFNAYAKVQTYNTLNFSFDADSRASVTGAQHTWYDQAGVAHDDAVTAVPAGALTDGTAVAVLGADWEQGKNYPHMIFENDCGPAKVYYTVQFKDWDGTDIGAAQQVIRGGAAVAPPDPVRVGYTFDGWDKDFSSVKEDMVITATYVINHYTVTFKDYDGTAIGAPQDITHGSDAVPPADPEREGYTFTGWNPPYTAIISNTDCIAQYTINKYLVRFLDWDDSVLKQENVEWQGAAEAPEDPVRAGWTFTGWDKEFDCITSNTDVKATYVQGEVTTYNVVFQDWDETVISEQIVPEGSAAVEPPHPQREGYDPDGWDKTFDNIQADTVVTACYKIKYFDVTFLDWDDSVYEVVPTAWHTAAVPPAVPPTRPWHTFREWVGDISCVTSPCSAKAAYDIVVDRYVGTAEEFAFHVTNADSRIVVHLTNDIVLTDWPVCDFAAKIEGNGQTIKGLIAPFFSGFTGVAENLILDGDLEGTGGTTKLIATKIDLGVFCKTNCGGRISGVVLTNFNVEVSNSTSYKSVGLLVGIIKDGASIEGCTICDSCKMIQRNCYVGSFAGAVGCSDEYKASAPIGSTTASIISCTNRAEINTYYSGTSVIGGILGLANSYDSTFKPVTMISNCVNYGSITSSADSPGGCAAGILGERSVNVPASNVGSLHIVDCANYGDVGPVAAGMTYGGCIGHVYRLGNIHVMRFANYGRVGGPLSPKGNPITGGSSGGFIGYVQDGYGSNPIVFTDSANYGDVYGFTRAGGFFDQFTPNAGHPDTKCAAYNCANYGKLTALSETGLAGEIFALFGSNPSVSASRVYGAYNSFFPTETLIASNNCSFVHTDNCVSAEDDGYDSLRAMKKLKAYAAENGYAEWCHGRVNGVKVPELKIFCQDPVPPPGMLMLIR